MITRLAYLAFLGGAAWFLLDTWHRVMSELGPALVSLK
jgi:hypothetical protein